MKTQTKAEMQDEIDHLKLLVADLQGEVAGLKYALKVLPEAPPPAAPYTWTWPSTVFPTWELAPPTNEPYKVIC